MRRTIAVLTIAAAAVLGLSACSDVTATPASSNAAGSTGSAPGGAGASTQTAADACAMVQQAITDATTQLVR